MDDILADDVDDVLADDVLAVDLDELLSDQEARFVDEYIIDFNGKRSYTVAFNSKKYASQNASALMKKEKIQNAIKKAIAERANRVQVQQDQVIDELVKIAFTNMLDFVEWKGEAVTLKDSGKLNRVNGAAVAEVSQTITQYGGRVSFKLHSKEKALELLGKHLGMFTDKVQLEGGETPIGHEHSIPDSIKEVLKNVYKPKTS
jgi:phage terminase small subunit